MSRQSYGGFLKDLFCCRVQKLNVNAGLSCPNRDGTLGWGGCIYCNNASFTPSFGNPTHSITQQLLDGMKFYKDKYHEMRYLAYFQSFTGTYAPLYKLQSLYEEALAVPGVVGLVISTRPDCLSDNVIDLLCDINKTHRVIVELGIETVHDSTLRRINRCHDWQCALNAVNSLASCDINVGCHLIMGLPGETLADMIYTVKIVSELPVRTIKFHQLQVLKGTELARQWESGEVELIEWTAKEYADFCAQILDILPERIIVERMVSTASSQLLLYPRWGLKPQQFKDVFEDL